MRTKLRECESKWTFASVYAQADTLRLHNNWPEAQLTCRHLTSAVLFWSPPGQGCVYVCKLARALQGSPLSLAPEYI